MPVRHAHRNSRFTHRRVYAGNTDVGVANDWEERIDKEGDDRWNATDAVLAENRYKESEKRETRNRLKNIGEAKDGSSQIWAASEEDSQGHADEGRASSGNEDKKEMLGRKRAYLVSVLSEEIQNQPHLH